MCEAGQTEDDPESPLGPVLVHRHRLSLDELTGPPEVFGVRMELLGLKVFVKGDDPVNPNRRVVLLQGDELADLARCLASLLDVEDDGLGRLIDKEAKADLRQVWTPTAENFFARVEGPTLDALWCELLELAPEHPTATVFVMLRKWGKAERLEQIFAEPRAVRGRHSGASRPDCQVAAQDPGLIKETGRAGTLPQPRKRDPHGRPDRSAALLFLAVRRGRNWESKLRVAWACGMFVDDRWIIDPRGRAGCRPRPE
ncbi:hypothetical protein FHG66_10585 [Rubellimicrobium rubrum]|uniref:Uncharacterized protein n=2 Tax=Rubellimicrobium rubrum TaxID=2585369 RepID=A0A5C4MY80_9RHOB|nr:hypothetical protein FHG66_10585 [Rubellimicrobium rubrum]